MMDTQRSVSSSTDSLFSFDCALQDLSSLKVPYTKLLVFFLMPLVSLLPVGIVWLIWGRVKDRKEIAINYFVATIIILFFLLHPTILKEMMSFFNCTSVESSLYLINDTAIECFKGSHLVYSFLVGFPGLLLWGVGIPTIGLVLLFRARKYIKPPSTYNLMSKYDKVMEKRTSQKYGFLY